VGKRLSMWITVFRQRLHFLIKEFESIQAFRAPLSPWQVERNSGAHWVWIRQSKFSTRQFININNR
jgi:hypothetical protein